MPVLSPESLATALIDPEAGKRYKYVAEVGKEKFAGSALVDPSQEITEETLDLIEDFHQAVSPVNPLRPWTRADVTTPLNQEFNGARNLIDSSTYKNWQLPGGPLEHIRMTTTAAKLATSYVQKNLRPITQVNQKHHRMFNLMQQINPFHVAAGGGLHDEGREVSHTFFTNERIGRALLIKMGIRPDLIDIMPDEKVMLLLPTENMNEYILGLNPEAVILRIADEFGKRFPKTNRLYTPKDYTNWDRQKWADSYISKPLTGRPSDRQMRKNMQQHIDNVPRYFAALDNWLRTFTTLDLDSLIIWLGTQSEMQLEPLATETAAR